MRRALSTKGTEAVEDLRDHPLPVAALGGPAEGRVSRGVAPVEYVAGHWASGACPNDRGCG